MNVREVMGAFLTLSMFMMLANMIKRDHFDGDVLMDVPKASFVAQDFTRMTRHKLLELPSQTSKNYGQRLKLCFNNTSPPKVTPRSKGFVTFSLTDGPEYHVSQVANAVLVAKNLGATLVLPEIIGSKGEKRAFGEIYDTEKFITSMRGVIQVEQRKPRETWSQKPVNVKVPYYANRNYIMNKVEPMFKTTQNVRVISYLATSTMQLGEVDKDMSPHSCWATFEALRLKPELQELVDTVVGNLKNREPNGRLVAIDYKTEMLGMSICRRNLDEEMKNCYNPIEIAQFLQRIGYPRDSKIYVTQSKVDRSLRPLKDLYPNTVTKEDIMQEVKNVTFLDPEMPELEQDIIDFHVCSISDVFIPSKSGLFYANVAGNRIATTRTDILVPAQITSSLAQDHVSSYVSKGNHPAYACFCE